MHVLEQRVHIPNGPFHLPQASDKQLERATAMVQLAISQELASIIPFPRQWCFCFFSNFAMGVFLSSILGAISIACVASRVW